MASVHKPGVSVPLNDSVIIALARLVDDSQTDEKREPSHSAIEHQIDRAHLSEADPNRNRPDRPVGKQKRIREVLSWAIEHDVAAGELFVGYLLAQLRALGGFRANSPNFVGAEPIQNLTAVLRADGVELTSDGEVHTLLLDNLEGLELTAALKGYIRRARRGAEDAALVTGTGKDLMEATAAHVLVARFGSYPQTENFETLLGQAFKALDLATPLDPEQSNEAHHRRMERALYQLARGVNRLRNKQGTGHGRSFLPTVTPQQAKTAVEAMGLVAEYLLAALA